MEDVAVSIRAVSKGFNGQIVLRNINIDFPRGKISTVLGPSGAGKTTMLKIIAGLEYPDTGRVYINGRDVTMDPPWKRGIAMVFQEAALLPHMNVYENIAFGLEPMGLGRKEIDRRVMEAAELLRISHLLNRYPEQLSGGEAKRVSLARALVLKPRILLLDEPFSNLDLALREQLRRELRNIQRRLGITVIHVTHDQDEALEMSDYIAILYSGEIIDHGETLRVYEKPVNKRAALFWGHNILPSSSEIARCFGLDETCNGYYVIPPHFLDFTDQGHCRINTVLIRRNHALVSTTCHGVELYVATTIMKAKLLKPGEPIGVRLSTARGEVSLICE